MKNKRSLAMGSVLAASLLALTACATAESPDPPSSAELPESVDLQGETVVALYTSFNNDYYSSWDQGAKRAVEAFNGNYVAFTNEGDAATQLSQFEQQVDAGVKIFFVTAPDPANIPAMAQIATENEVCLVNTWEQPEWTSPFEMGDGYITYLTNDSVTAGYEVATALFEEMGGEGNFVHLTGFPGSTPDSQRTVGVDMALADYPGITLVAREPGQWNRDDSRQVMAGIISRFGSEIDGVFGQNDDVAIGALNALTEAGIEGVPITGIDGNAGTMELVQAGQIFGSYSSLPQWGAGFSFVTALDACRGAEVHPLNRQLWTGGIFVTADNVESYLNTYTGDNDPYDWVKMSRLAHPEDWDPQNSVRTLDIEEMWSFAERPAGFELPAEYEAALSERESIDAEWADRWRLVK